MRRTTSAVAGNATLFGSVSILTLTTVDMWIFGVFLTRVDEKDGKRYFACMMGNPGGCACCAPGGVIEFEPKSSYKWPTSVPPIESRITVSGLLKMVAVEDGGQIYSVPRLFEADVSH